MRKSWFELTHYYYLPPHLPDEGGGFANGQMCLGHIVKDFKPFECSEEPINQSKEGIMFAPAVTINHTTWKEVEGKQSAPIGAGVSILAAHQTKFACGNPEENCKEGATFDRYTFEPDREFISRILEDEKVAAHIKRTKGVQLLGFGGRWSVYMVTGITVARDAKLRIEFDRIIHAMADSTSDFVCAVRLTKIWKSAMRNDWDFRTETKGADCL